MLLRDPFGDFGDCADLGDECSSPAESLDGAVAGDAGPALCDDGLRGRPLPKRGAFEAPGGGCCEGRPDNRMR